MSVIKKTIKEALALIVIAFVLGFVGNEFRGPARIEPFKNYFAKRVPVASPADVIERNSSDADPIDEGQPEQQYQTIDFDGVADAVVKGVVGAGAMVLIDARGDEAYEEGHIPGALQCDHFKLERDIFNVLDFVDAAETIVVYCNGGKCEDSLFVCGDLMEFDVPFDKIYLFQGGWEEWTENNMRVEGGRVN